MGWKGNTALTFSPFMGFTSMVSVQRAPGTHWVGGSVGPRASLNGKEKRKSFTLPALELRTLERPARSRSLHSATAALYPVSTGSYLPRLKRQERETDHLPPSSAEINSGGTIPPHPHASSCYSSQGQHSLALRKQKTDSPFPRSIRKAFSTRVRCNGTVLIE
jgi:hypothetical protein